VRVTIYKVGAGETAITSPQFETDEALSGHEDACQHPGFPWGQTEMTQLAFVIDLNVCVGCHACVTSCKEWNTAGQRRAAAAT
jgi:ferredoxin